MRNPIRYFNSSPAVIRLAVMMYIRYPLSLRQVEDLLFERGIDICQETVRLWWNRFGPMFAAESPLMKLAIRRRNRPIGAAQTTISPRVRMGRFRRRANLMVAGMTPAAPPWNDMPSCHR